MSYIDLAGQKIGRWSVLFRTDKKKVVKYVCQCECGNKREVLSASLRSGKSKGCGCRDTEKSAKAIRKIHRSTYISWIGMRNRCNYKGHIEYHRYGGRGISYDPRWNDFLVFLDEMGTKPDQTSLDRIDNNKGYCKENCRWATREEQSSNTSRNVLVSFDGQSFTLKRLAKKLGISYDRLHMWHRTNSLCLEEAILRASKPGRLNGNKHLHKQGKPIARGKPPTPAG